MQKITTFIAFESKAEEAVKHYVSIFKNSKILKTSHYGEGAPLPKGTVMVVEFELEGVRYVAMNGGPHFKFTDAFSLSIDCIDQKEVDHYTEKLVSGGGQQGPCGWVTDRFGMRWQVNPSALGRMLSDPDPAKAKRVMTAMLKMTKIDIATLEKAYEGK